jgi:putative copper export protein
LEALYPTILVLHVVGGSVWVGGHLVLVFGVLPGVLRERSVEKLLDFESKFERVGIPALMVQVATGLALAHRLSGEAIGWFEWSHPTGRSIAIKLMLLAATVALAMHARLRLIPRLTPERLPLMAVHIIGVTILSLLFLYTGVGLRYGGWW